MELLRSGWQTKLLITWRLLSTSHIAVSKEIDPLMPIHRTQMRRNVDQIQYP